MSNPVKDDIDTFRITYINDSGAGRAILSRKALLQNQVTNASLSRAIGTSANPVTFETGGGDKTTKRSLGLVGGTFGSTEAFVLEDSPNAISLSLIHI